MTLTREERARLAALARIMIPGGAGQPGAADLRLQDTPVEEVLRIDSSRLAPLRRFLALKGETDDLPAIEALAQRDPEGFGALSIVLANAYFMQPEVRRAIGYPGQEARDSSVGLNAEDMELVSDVTRRGAVYRTA
ncbi:hypothetical protein [Roseicyclus sp.]|uniref:hypothetical protein n=1 Tax=Roseicyclus sp. TaxID=1914329 RepID=UPI003FA1303E